MFELVRAIHDAFDLQSPAAFALFIGGLFATLFGAGGGTVGYIVDKAYRKAEERRLLALVPNSDPYVIRVGSSSFRLDTLDQDLRRVGIRFVSMSSPQLKPTPENDNVRMEYIPLKNGLFLRAQWRNGDKMPDGLRALAERVILAHEARLKVQ
jgi:hypothetical protein